MEEKDLDIISGAKGSGKGGGGRSPQTADDSLDSLASAKILDAICEGRIEGFPSALDEGLAFGATNYNKFAQKDVYLDDTPIVDADAELNNQGNFDEDDVNFENVVVTSRIGTDNQGIMGGFRSLRQEFPVSTANIPKETPVVKQISKAAYPNIDQIGIIINVPALQKFEDDGDIVNTGVTFRIEYQILGGDSPTQDQNGNSIYVTPFPTGFNNTGNRHISGRTGDPFQRQYIFNVPDGYATATTLNLRVSRISDNPTTRTQSDIQWFSYQLITFDPNTYPNTALVGFQVSSETFSSIPRRYYRLRGTRIAVPKGVYTDNNNPIDPNRAGRLVYNSSATWAGGTSITANGTLRGTWQRLYSNDPAWCLYDLLVNTRYGLSIPETSLDEFSFWNISQYNSELVTNSRDSLGSKSGTWTLAANHRFCVVTCTVDHKYQTGDLISITFTSGTSGSSPAAQDTTVILKIRRMSKRRFRVLKVTPNATALNGNCTFTDNQEARFSFNEYINKEFKAYDLINAICSNMRVMPYWSSGTLFLSQDKPATQVNGGTYSATQDVLPAYIFNKSNVIDGNFTYEGSDIKNRATLVIAKYYDNNQRKISYEQFPSQTVIGNTTIGDVSATTSAGGDIAIAKYGILKKTVQAYGCTSSGQAHRLAKWTRFSEQLLTETVTFSVSIDAGVILRVGQVIAINDDVKTGVRRGGRIFGVTGMNKITVDDANASNLPANNVGYTRTLNVLMPDGSVSKKTVSDITGSVITTTGNFQLADGTQAAPNVMSTWILETSGGNANQNLQNQLYRVLLVEEESSHIFKVTALLYNHSIYAAVETGSDVTFRDATNIDVKPKRPAAATIIERLYKESIHNANNNSNKVVVRSKLIIQWSQVTDVSKFLLKININGVERLQEVTGQSYEILNVRAGKEFQVRVFSIGPASGKLSGFPRTAKNSDGNFGITTVGKSDPPNNVTGLNVTANGTTSGNLITFDENDPNPSFNDGPNSPSPQIQFKDLDIAFYEVHKTNVNLSTSQINQLFGTRGTTYVGRKTAPDLLTKDFLSTAHTYYIKARDTGGRYSTAANSFVFTPQAPSAPQAVSGFPKIENGMVVLNWEEPATIGSYAIKRYEVSDGSNTTKKIKSNVTTYSTPLNFIGSKTFTVKAINLAGAESPALSQTFTIPEPVFPNGAVVKVNITKENIILNWPNTTKVANMPTVIGYKVQTSYQDSQVNSEENIFPITVRDSRLIIPITAANINRNNGNNISRTFTINPVYQRADFPDVGIISTSAEATLTKTIIFTRPPAPTMKSIPVIFTGDQVTLRWQPVASGFNTATNTAIFKILKYGIYNTSNVLLFETNSTSFTFELDHAEDNNNMSKNFRIRALDSGYVNEDEQAIKNYFRGPYVQQTVQVTPFDPPSNGAYKLGTEGGQGFITISYDRPIRTRTENLAFKDYKITRSTSSTFTGITNGNTDLVVFTNSQSFKEEVSWLVSSGQRNYYVQTRDVNNNLSTTALKIAAIIEVPSEPLASNTGTTEVIDNNVLLRWRAGGINTTTQLKIATFEIRKHKDNANDPNDFASATVIGRVDGIFNVVFEQVADIYTYHIAAVDSAGNIGPSFKTTQRVSQPPDFVLNDNFFSDFTTSPAKVLSNTLSNVLLANNSAYIPVNTTETWKQHFIGTGSEASPQFNTMTALITANPTNLNYLEPAPSTGSYEEVYDYGTNLASTKITVTQGGSGFGSGSLQHQGIINTAPDANGAFTTDGVTQTGTSFFRFGTQFRRVKYRTIVNSTNGRYRKITSLNLKLDTKILNDTGIGTANASDSGGTQVNFNVSFVDVQGISVTPNTINESDIVNKKLIAVVDFVDSPNPTNFKVYLFNISGTRVSGNFTWQCRGT